MVATFEPSSEPSMASTTPRVSSWFWDSFEVPDGYKAEIIREELVVTPSPSKAHQIAVADLEAQDITAPPDGYVCLPGLEWRLDQDGIVAQAPQPDVVVVRRADEKQTDPPLLAVEVLSPSDHHRLDTHDLTRIEGKRQDFAEHGLQDYLEVDFLEGRRQIRRYELIDGVLDVVETVDGDEVLRATRPFAYSIRPVDLLP
jgi:Uma2 family endonuclease